MVKGDENSICDHTNFLVSLNWDETSRLLEDNLRVKVTKLLHDVTKPKSQDKEMLNVVEIINNRSTIQYIEGEKDDLGYQNWTAVHSMFR